MGFTDDDKCYSRVSGLLFGIILFSLFLHILVERVLRALFGMETGFSGFASRRVILEVLNLAMMIVVLRHAPGESTIADQSVVYAVGLAVSLATLFYFWLLEDCSPFLCLDPVQHFAMGMTMEQYWTAFLHASTSATFAGDCEKHLGISTRDELESVLSLMTLRFEIRQKNMRRMCLASYPMMALNFAIFITNMVHFCDYAGNNFIIDASSVLSIVLIGATRRDILVFASDTFMAKFLQTAEMYRTNFKRKLTLKGAVQKLVTLKRMGFQLPPMHNKDETKRYSYSTAHYAAKQFVDDVVEDSTNLRVWYETHILEVDEHNGERGGKGWGGDDFSERAAEETNAGSDPRLIACLACNWVSKDLSERACPDERMRGETPLSNIVLYLASLTIERLAVLAMTPTNSLLHLKAGITDELVKLAIIVALQAEFDAAEQKDLPGSLGSMSSASKLLERLSGMLEEWCCSTDPRSLFYTKHENNNAEGSGPAHRGLKDIAHQHSIRSFQILYISDVDFRDNTSFFDAGEVKNKVVDLIAHKLDRSVLDYDRAQKELFDKDVHLYSAGGLVDHVLRKVPTVGFSSREAETAMALQKAEEGEDPSTKGPTAQPDSTAILVDSADCQKNPRCVPFAKQNRCAPSPGEAGCGDDSRCTPSVKSKFERKSPFEFISATLIGKYSKIDSDQIADELQCLQENEAALAEAGRGHGAGIILAYLSFWARNSVLVKFILWVNWRRTAWSVLLFLFSRLAMVVLFVPLCFVNAVYRAIDGKLFTSSYWLGLLPLTLRKWSSSQTNSFIIDKFAVSLITGILSYRFMLCAVHIGEPVNSYNRGGIVAVILASLFVVLFASSMVGGQTRDAKTHLDWLLPASALILGGFLAVHSSGETLADELYLGLGPAYDMTDPWQTLMVPVLYGLMHDSLVLFCFLPLTMCRLTLLRICELPYVGSFAARLLGTHNMYGLHRELGYLMLTFILVGAVIWWVAIYHACSYGSIKACRAFYPEGNYFDIRGPPWFCEKVPTDHEFFKVWINYSSCVVQSGGNPGAVLFLRQVITFLLTMICITAELKYPLLLSQTGTVTVTVQAAKSTKTSRYFQWWTDLTDKASALSSKLYKDYLGPNEFEVFIYTHIVITYAIALAAFFSRFEVFHDAAVCWGLFFLEKIVVVLLHTHSFKISKESEQFEGAIKLVLKKRHWMPWKSRAGEIAFLQCPRIGPFWLGRQWHAFSLASSNSDSADDTHDQIEFLIQVHGKGSWTHSLSNALFDPKSKLSYNAPIYLHVRGPFGSSFEGYRAADVIMLIGGGSGIASSLSVLRELVAFRGNVKKVWFIFATRQFSR